jgi:hypothetical protein
MKNEIKYQYEKKNPLVHKITNNQLIAYQLWAPLVVVLFELVRNELTYWKFNKKSTIHVTQINVRKKKKKERKGV